MILSFYIPSTFKYSHQKPSALLSHLVGDEVEGSLAYFLKDEELVTEVMVGSSSTLHYYEKFSLTFSLTNKGRENVDLIFEAVGKYLHLLRQQNSLQ